MLGVEAALAEAGVRVVLLHARVSVLGFYAKLGYLAEGDDFPLVGIPHRAMRKRLDR
jgi:predicted GNAT family N-acyltransferase